ncbi:Meiotic coiled-coil protein 2 [Mycena venus]|uniref:Meiotic coiled-coil protein 2 n=1 Tax=Mycena venus TaxID=2733690 RepID=A0A8H6XD39_9AGAR|nr:Meiotic coiled-coil protein 2 [Mycena venus]
MRDHSRSITFPLIPTAHHLPLAFVPAFVVDIIKNGDQQGSIFLHQKLKVAGQEFARIIDTICARGGEMMHRGSSRLEAATDPEERPAGPHRRPRDERLWVSRPPVGTRLQGGEGLLAALLRGDPATTRVNRQASHVWNRSWSSRETHRCRSSVSPCRSTASGPRLHALRLDHSLCSAASRTSRRAQGRDRRRAAGAGRRAYPLTRIGEAPPNGAQTSHWPAGVHGGQQECGQGTQKGREGDA